MRRRGAGEGSGVTAHPRVVLVRQQPDRGAALAGADRELDVVAPGAREAVERVAVSHGWHREAAQMNAPPRVHPGDHRSPGIATRVRREIPCGVLKQPPVHELRAGRVGVAVLIEGVGRGELPHTHFEPRAWLQTRKLVHPARQRVPPRPERDEVSDEQARHVGTLAEVGAPLPNDVAVRDPAKSHRSADPRPARHLEVHIDVKAGGQPRAEVRAVGIGGFGLDENGVSRNSFFESGGAHSGGVAGAGLISGGAGKENLGRPAVFEELNAPLGTVRTSGEDDDSVGFL